MIKKVMSIFLTAALAVAIGICGCGTEKTPPETVQPDIPNPVQPDPDVPDTPDVPDLTQTRVKYSAIPDGVEEYSRAEVYLGDEKLPVYSVMVNTSQSWVANNYKRVQSGAAIFAVDGKVQVTVKPDVKIDYSSKVRPLSSNIIPIADIDENTLTFTISGAGEYVLEINGDKDNVIHFFVSGFDAGQLPQESDGYQNVIIFPAGLHTAANNQYISSGNTVTLRSNTYVYIADGAVVRGRFLANGASHILISGNGIIDGSAFDRDAEKGTVTVPLEFNDCKDVTLKDFTVLDPAGWCVNFYFTNDSQIDGIKIISSRSNGDGISLQSCQNITVDGCFVRTWDDSLVVKNYPRWSDRSKYGATRGIKFTDCIIWTDLAQSMEIGYETVGVTLEDVSFENITVLHALDGAAISIHNANNADIKNITYRGITIEDAYNAGCIIDIRVLFSTNWSTIHTTTALGSISGVTVENVKILSARKISLNIGGCRDVRQGYESEHYVDGITFRGIELASRQPDYDDWSVKETGYLKNVTLIKADEVTGAILYNKD